MPDISIISLWVKYTVPDTELMLGVLSREGAVAGVHQVPGAGGGRRASERGRGGDCLRSGQRRPGQPSQAVFGPNPFGPLK